MLCLKVATDRRWAHEAVRDVDTLLVDHAHCEVKAASNALSLAVRHPDDLELVRALTDLAREEIDHFQRVLAILVARGIKLSPPPVDTYAANLRRAALDLRPTSAAGALVDRLLVAALIEARSCERFKLLAEAVGPPETEAAASLVAFWQELFAAEAGHYRTFVDLAVRAASGDRDAVASRLERLSELEARIVTAHAAIAEGVPRASVHG